MEAKKRRLRGPPPVAAKIHSTKQSSLEVPDLNLQTSSQNAWSTVRFERDIPELFMRWMPEDDEELFNNGGLIHPIQEIPEQNAGPIDVQLVHQVPEGLDLTEGPQVIEHWKAIELWTKNRIYYLNQWMQCVEVYHRQQESVESSHALLRAYLVGGHFRDQQRVHTSHPLPLPGHRAVFRQIGISADGIPEAEPRYAYTSAVERVIFRQLACIQNMA